MDAYSVEDINTNYLSCWARLSVRWKAAVKLISNEELRSVSNEAYTIFQKLLWTDGDDAESPDVFLSLPRYDELKKIMII